MSNMKIMIRLRDKMEGIFNIIKINPKYMIIKIDSMILDKYKIPN
jgi:hypothetical protein